jgi:preprotein translocase subunit SecG
MYLTFTILAVALSVFLIFFVLVQNSKGGGLAAGFSSSNQVLGVRKTTDFLEKATWSLIGAIVVLSILAAGVRKDTKDANSESSILKEQRMNMQQQASETAVPNFGEMPEAPVQQPVQSSTQPSQPAQSK